MYRTIRHQNWCHERSSKEMQTSLTRREPTKLKQQIGAPGQKLHTEPQLPGNTTEERNHLHQLVISIRLTIHRAKGHVVLLLPIRTGSRHTLNRYVQDDNIQGYTNFTIVGRTTFGTISNKTTSSCGVKTYSTKPLSFCWSSSAYTVSVMGWGCTPIFTKRFCLGFAFFPHWSWRGCHWQRRSGLW
jgi:hypothetical protein